METETQIDHVLIDGRHFSDIIDVRTYRGANIDSDHYLVMVKLRPKLSVVNNVRYRRPPRYNLDRLRDTEVATAYARHLEAALLAEEELNDAPLEDCWTRTKAAISNAAESVLGYVPRSRRNEWWRQHYDEHLNSAQADNQALEEEDYVSVAADGDVPVPTMNEFKEAIQQLKTNKAAGKDGLGAELFKRGPEKLTECMHRIIEEIWDREQLPEDICVCTENSIPYEDEQLLCQEAH
ncbi:uncharacterized protein LOC131429306 [Malaya genurostris]|uniref:uncharacterized protein LOC131429306 n=1 Tax=Malaya genurostris TaxID=325434 RepID=UPI0026F3E6BB|nr:uncharacterized protein LOC131429306 [Malaya genurostris]